MNLYLVQYSYYDDYSCIFYTLHRKKAQAALREQLKKELKLSRKLYKIRREDLTEEDIEDIKDTYARYKSYGFEGSLEDFIEKELKSNREMFYRDMFRWHIKTVEIDKDYSFS